MRSLLLSFLIFICGFLVRASNRRVKRVIDGEVVDKEMNSPYGVLKYFVVMGNGHNCDIGLPGALSKFLDLPHTWGIGIPSLGFVCRPQPHHLKCTGTLLTSFVVQTACHCVAHFYSVPNGTEFPVIENVFENRYDIFPGNLKVKEITGGVAPNRYLSHPKCYKDSNWKTLLHDYALIVLKTSFNDFRTVPAPVYTEGDLVKLWTVVQAEKKMCLVIGFGTFKREDTSVPPDLLHAWFQAMDYISCFSYSYNYGDGYNYKNDSSWFCTSALPTRQSQISGHGDSGGPVTCDNQYAGLVSQSFIKRGIEVDTPMSTAFSLYENAFEYRAVLLDQLSKEMEPEEVLLLEYTVAPYLPSSPPIGIFIDNYYAKNAQLVVPARNTLRSMCILTIVQYYLLI